MDWRFFVVGPFVFIWKLAEWPVILKQILNQSGV
jgi:hypothetical protein